LGDGKAEPSKERLREAVFLPSDAVCRDVPTVLILGSEGTGLRAATAKCCDSFVYVPMQMEPESNQETVSESESSIEVSFASELPSLESLNVSTAAAILFHALRMVK
jgi:21S rRNA (GM2251-2'-O)-methyltransferase